MAPYMLTPQELFSIFSEFNLENAALFDGTSGHLTYKPAITGDRRIATYSTWVHLNGYNGDQETLFEASSGGAGQHIRLFFSGGNDGELRLYFETTGSDYRYYGSNEKFRDFSGWYHIVLVLDTTEAVEADRAKLYVNNRLITKTTVGSAGSSTLSLNQDLAINNTVDHYIGKYGSVSAYMNGYFADTTLIDGQALTPDNFGETNTKTGQWQAKQLDSSIDLGLNGFVQKHADANDLGASQDRATNVYATLNPSTAGASANTFTNGNRTYNASSASAQLHVYSSLMPRTGKWYLEATANAANGWSFLVSNGPTSGFPSNTDVAGWHRTTALNVYDFSTFVQTMSFATGDTVQMAIDMDNDEIWFGWYDDSTSTQNWYDSSGTARSTDEPGLGTNPTISGTDLSGISWGVASQNSQDITVNINDNDLVRPIPTGFSTLSTNNLPAVDTTTVDEHFKTVLYEGNGTVIGSGGNAVTGVGFQPDFVWIKERSGVQNHKVYDSLRGVGYRLNTDLTSADQYQAEGLASFDTDGFTVGNDTAVNTASDTYVAWCASLPSDETNTSGDISVTWKYNATLGMAVGTYTGSGTAGDTLGLPTINGTAPGMFTVKKTSGVAGWPTYHKTLGGTHRVFLNYPDASAAQTSMWNDTAPTSSVITLGNDADVNGSSETYVVIVFWKSDFIDIGSYTGNGSTDGPFVNSVDPVWSMVKNTNAARSWNIIDTIRSPYNSSDDVLEADTSTAEQNGVSIWGRDYTPYGTKIVASHETSNGSGHTHVYINIGEPTKRAALKGANYQTNGGVEQVSSNPSNPAATINALNCPQTLTNGNRTYTDASQFAGSNSTAQGSLLIKSGKYYWEGYVDAVGTSSTVGFGITKPQPNTHTTAFQLGGDTTSIRYIASNGDYRVNGSNTTYGSSFTTGDVIGVAVDYDSDQITFYKNNVSQGVISFTMPSEGVVPGFYFVDTLGGSITARFDESDFSYTPPTGFNALTTDNITAVNDNIDNHFKTVLRSGNQTAGTVATGLTSTDFIWTKNRTAGAGNHFIFDSVRGTTKYLSSNSTNAEATDTNSVTAFGTDSYTTGNSTNTNATGVTYVDWCASLPSDEVNTSGTISTTWKYNSTLGMATGVYTGNGTAGATLGLPTINGKAPSMLLCKCRSNTGGWQVYHKDLTSATYRLELDSTAAESSASTIWNSTAPTSSVVTVGSAADTNGSARTYVIHAFWETDFCKIGTYAGNSDDKTGFINLGGRPVWWLSKSHTNAGQEWLVFDEQRNTYNPVNTKLEAHSSAAETTSTTLSHDFTANGISFQQSSANGAMNYGTGSHKYIYLAFVQPNTANEVNAR
ncbi:SPRY domain-containing protein [Magnetovibrio sp. PR-2]|uniref:DUF7483 domain-containing protein n=1 Tax=Magnetovibrio sp. PR-2 TaxID=3120356 RepID=UPI002FCDFF7D